MTSSIDYLREANRIVVLNNGRIEIDRFIDKNDKELKNLELSAGYFSKKEFIESIDQEPDQTIGVDKNTSLIKNRQNEEIKCEKENLGAFFSYFKSGSGYIGLSVVLILYICAQCGLIIADLWLSEWLLNFIFILKLVNYDI